jgi:hypothetical protein
LGQSGISRIAAFKFCISPSLNGKRSETAAFRDLSDIEVIHLSHSGTPLDRGQEFAHARSLPFGKNFHRRVRAIPNLPGDVQAIRHPLNKVAKPDALNPAVHNDLSRDSGHIASEQAQV